MAKMHSFAALPHERTAGRCLKALEEAGLVAWVHRVRRIKEVVAGGMVRVVRSSNSYDFPPAIHTDRQNDGGTRIPDLRSPLAPAAPGRFDPRVALAQLKAMTTTASWG